MRMKAEGPKESAADRARREAATDQADAAAERSISDDLRSETDSLTRRFGALAGPANGRGGAGPARALPIQEILRRALQMSFGGGPAGRSGGRRLAVGGGQTTGGSSSPPSGGGGGGRPPILSSIQID